MKTYLYTILVIFCFCLNCGISAEDISLNTEKTPTVESENNFTLTSYPLHFSQKEADKIAVINTDNEFSTHDLLTDMGLAFDPNLRLQDKYYTGINPQTNEIVIYSRINNSKLMAIKAGNNPQDAIIFYNYLFIANTNDMAISIIRFIVLD